MSEGQPARNPTTDRERWAATRIFVTDMLVIMGQPDDAANAAFVDQIARKILRAMPLWTHPSSPLRATQDGTNG